MRSFPLIVVTSSAFVAGCATPSSRPLSARIVAPDSRSLTVSKVHAELRDDGIIVTGHVTRKSMLRQRILGHLHIEAIAGTRIVAWTDARWTSQMRRKCRITTFLARLQAVAGPVDEIRVTHVDTKHGEARASRNPS